MNTRITIAIVALVAAVVAASALGFGSLPSGPDPLPTVVGISVSKDAESSGSGTSTNCGCPGGLATVRDFRAFRQWSDGRLDAVRVTFASDQTPTATVIVILPGMECFADVDRDGLVGITDFLNVLGEWGDCG